MRKGILMTEHNNRCNPDTDRPGCESDVGSGGNFDQNLPRPMSSGRHSAKLLRDCAGQ
jgi:hypothetical protein